MKECSRCISNDTLIPIWYDENGVCNYCHAHDELEKQYPIYDFKLLDLADEIRRSGWDKPFDCIIGISGGKDSSFLLHFAVKTLGLRPLTIHYDNGWDNPIATHNIRVMVDALNVSFINYRVPQEEVDDVIRAFLFSHTQDAESHTDLAFVKLTLEYAAKYGIKYILNGHSFRTEGMAPVGWSYMDARYIQSVYDAGGGDKLRSLPMLTLTDQIRYGLKGIKRVRPLYYIDYQSDKARTFLESEYGWQWYGGHHLENIWTAFFDYYYRYNKLGYDGRLVELSAFIRSGQMTKERAKEVMAHPALPPDEEKRIVWEVKDRLGIDDWTFQGLMDPSERKTHRDWKTYRTHFKVLRPVFWAMSRMEMIPKTFYTKYCKE